MNYHCVRSITFDAIESAFQRTMFPHLKIKFNLSLHTEYFNYALNQDSNTGPQFLESLPSSNYSDIAQVTVQESLSFDDVEAVLREAIGDRLAEKERRRVIMLAWREVLKSFPDETLHKYTILSLGLKIKVSHWHVYVVESDYHGMVPAADSAFLLLQKCVGAAKERCCCICLEELGRGEAFRMPCSHVFHGGCIKEWLRTSHYCPLCRYEMPTK